MFLSLFRSLSSNISAATALPRALVLLPLFAIVRHCSPLFAIVSLLSGCSDSDDIVRFLQPEDRVVALQITPANSELPQGMQQQYQLTAFNSDGSNLALSADPNVVWQIDNPTIASIDAATGIVTSLSAGETVVSATYSNGNRELQAQAQLVVTDAIVVTLQITPAATTIPAGLSTTYTATAFFSDGTSRNVSDEPSLTWQSDNPTIATIDQSGVATGLSAGSATITASGSANQQAFSASVALEVTDAELTSIQLSPNQATLPAGLVQQFQVTGFYSDGSTQALTNESALTWRVGNSGLATVNESGLLSANRVGSTQVEAAFNDGSKVFSASAEVTISAAVPTALQLNPSSVTIANGLTQQLTATAFFSDGSAVDVTAYEQVTWQIDDPTVATIDASGQLTAQQVGTAEVTAFASNNGIALQASAEIEVNNAVVTALQLSPDNASIAAGLSKQWRAIAFLSDGQSIDVSDDPAISWQIDDINIATVTDDGQVSALSAGSATLQVSGNANGVLFSDSAELTVTSAIVTALELTPTAITTPVGLSQAVQAIVHFSDGSRIDASADPAISWQIDDTAVAVVDGTGTITGSSVGSTTLTASGAANGVVFATSIPVTVTNATVTALQLTPANAPVAVGLSQQMTAIAFLSDGRSIDVTADGQLSWQIEDPHVASITQQGMVTGLTTGTTTIRAHGIAAGQAFNASASLQVTEAVISSIQVSPNRSSLPVGFSQVFQATAFFSDGHSSVLSSDSPLSWQIDDPALASIDSDGNVVGLATGTTSVNATVLVDGIHYRDSAQVTITAAVITALQVTPATTTIPAGATIQYVATAFMSDGNSKDLSRDPLLQWNVADTQIATIDNQGLVRGLVKGDTKISATAAIDGLQASGHADIEISDAVPVALTITPQNPSIPAGLSQKLTATATYSDGNLRDVSSHPQLSWQVDNTAVAAVENASGTLTAGSIGTVAVTATLFDISNTLQAQTEARVTSALISQLRVTPSSRSVIEGSDQQFLAFATFTDGTFGYVTNDPVINWGIDDPAIASLDSRSGLVSTNQSGVVTVTAVTTDGSEVSDSAALEVEAATIDDIELTPTEATVALGFSQRYSAIALYNNGTKQDITTDEATQWRVSDPQSATIDVTTATVTGVQPGTVTVSVVVNDNGTVISRSASLTINKAGIVRSWGDPIKGGDSSAIETELVNVKTVVANDTNFAAIKNDGSIIAWGDCPNTTVRIDSNGIKQLTASSKAFAALRQDGTVVTFGSTVSLGDPDSPKLHEQSDCLQIEHGQTYIEQIFANGDAFAGIKTDGTVSTWGDPNGGGDSSAVQPQLVNVVDIAGSADAFAAIKADGTVVTWGEGEDGGDSSMVAAELVNVESIVGSRSSDEGAFSALTTDRTVVFWGDPDSQASFDAVKSRLVNVKTVYRNDNAFAALTYDGDVISWGDSTTGGDSSSVQTQLNQVVEIVASRYAFAAIKADGSVVSWGSFKYGGDASAVQSQLTNVKSITATTSAFAALKSDHSVVVWGARLDGGDASGVDLTFVKEIYANYDAFVAIKLNGEVVTWGWGPSGGDSSGVDFSNVDTIFSHYNGTAFTLLKE